MTPKEEGIVRMLIAEHEDMGWWHGFAVGVLIGVAISLVTWGLS